MLLHVWPFKVHFFWSIPVEQSRYPCHISISVYTPEGVLEKCLNFRSHEKCPHENECQKFWYYETNLRKYIDENLIKFSDKNKEFWCQVKCFSHRKESFHSMTVSWVLTSTWSRIVECGKLWDFNHFPSDQKSLALPLHKYRYDYYRSWLLLLPHR